MSQNAFLDTLLRPRVILPISYLTTPQNPLYIPRYSPSLIVFLCLILMLNSVSNSAFCIASFSVQYSLGQLSEQQNSRSLPLLHCAPSAEHSSSGLFGSGAVQPTKEAAGQLKEEGGLGTGSEGSSAYVGKGVDATTGVGGVGAGSSGLGLSGPAPPEDPKVGIGVLTGGVGVGTRGGPPPPPVGALICKFRPFSLAQKATSSSRPPSFSMPPLTTSPRRRWRSARFLRSAPRFLGLSAAEDGTASTDSAARDKTIDEWWRIFIRIVKCNTISSEFGPSDVHLNARFRLSSTTRVP